MVEYYVTSKSEGRLVHCTGPVTAQVEMCKLVDAGKKPDDLRIEMVLAKKSPLRARANVARKRNEK